MRSIFCIEKGDEMRTGDYLPIEVVFRLLSRSRFQPPGRGAIPAAGSLQSQAGGQPIPVPRVTFWTGICRAVGLLDEGDPPRATLLADEWVTWDAAAQIGCLVNGWVLSPGQEKNRRARAGLLTRLSEGRTLEGIRPAEWAGLRALGVCTETGLTQLGSVVLGGRDAESLTVDPPEAWEIGPDGMRVPFPPDWKLVWELERYLNAGPAGFYPTGERELRAAAQRGGGLEEILERGARKPIPPGLSRALARQPVVRLIQGPVIEFSESAELEQLRRSRWIRRDLEHVLSPRHAALDPASAGRVLARLERIGWISPAQAAEFQPTAGMEPGGTSMFTRADYAGIVALLRLAEKMGVGLAPADLAMKTARRLPPALRAAAERRADKAWEKLRPRSERLAAREPVPFSVGPIEEILREAARGQEAVDILYQASGRHAPESRRITPLLVEARAGRMYVLAYCHLRRANRTFRLDRIQIMGFSDREGETRRMTFANGDFERNEEQE